MDTSKRNIAMMGLIVLIAAGMLGAACIMVVALRSWPQPVPNDSINLQYSTAHQHAMRAERQAIEEGKP